MHLRRCTATLSALVLLAAGAAAGPASAATDSLVVTMNDILITPLHDGTSNTIMFAETPPAPYATWKQYCTSLQRAGDQPAYERCVRAHRDRQGGGEVTAGWDLASGGPAT